MASIIKLAKTAFANHPIISNSVIYGTLFVGAECSQQVLSRKILVSEAEPQSLDIPTIQRYALYGTCMQGPILTVWYRWLDKKFVGTALNVVAKKLLVDQFTLTPVILVLFYVSMSLMEKKPHIFEECQNKFVPTFQRSCLFWLPVQTINFFLLPPAFRVVYVGTCSFAWINILCWIKRQ